MQFSRFGEYIPQSTLRSCAAKCGMCLQSCPFIDGNPDEDELARALFANCNGIQHRPETGYYLQSWVGSCSDEQQRLKSASGGLATWVQRQLLRQQMVDAVVSVTPCRGPEKLFQYTVSTSEEEIERGARSAYYPVHLANVVRHILATQARYAIVGLPCAIKGLRLAARQLPVLRERVRFHLGLVCEMTRSRGYAEYLCALSGGVPDKLEQIQFRLKSKNHAVTDYGISLEWKSEGGDVVSKYIRRSQYYERLNGRYFVPHACSFCDDTFCETADAVFMDAWLPDYNDYRGSSIVLVREPLIAEIVDRGVAENELQIQPISCAKMLQSQFSVVRKKRGLINYVSAFAKKKGQYVPRKRSMLPSLNLSYLERRLAIQNYHFARETQRLWLDTEKNVEAFWQQIQPLADKIRMLNRFRFLMSNPCAVIKRLLRVFVPK